MLLKIEPIIFVETFFILRHLNYWKHRISGSGSPCFLQPSFLWMRLPAQW